MTATQTEPLTMRVEDAARLLGISRGAAYAAARTGSLPGVLRVGGRILVSKSQLQRAIDGEAEKAGS